MHIAENFNGNLCDHIGETVTIYTTSGGESGSGFTGVLMAVNNCFIRLITDIGPAPGCALGSSCDCKQNNHYGGRQNSQNGYRNIGSVVDIPFDRIVAFVYNAV